MTDTNWVTIWAMAQTGGAIFACNLSNRTALTTISSSLRGDSLRLELSNRYGTGEVKISRTAVVVSGPDGARKIHKEVRFHQASEIALPVGGQVQSDAVDVPIEVGSRIEVRLYFAEGQIPISGNALVTSKHSPLGDHSGAIEFPVEESDIWINPNRPFEIGQPTVMLTAIDIRAQDSFTVAVLGDSNAFSQTWTIPFSDRLTSERKNISLLNLGISGNRLLRGTGNPMLQNIFGNAGIERLKWDIFAKSGMRYLIVAVGGNDLYQPGTFACPDIAELCSAPDLIAGYRTVIEQARQHGMRVVGTTISPFGGVDGIDDSRQKLWEDVNDWIRMSGEFDAVIDFAGLLSGTNKSAIRAEFDSGDHLHFNQAAGNHISENINLAMFD
jgi:lysophospholipase L1-like esterase